MRSQWALNPKFTLLVYTIFAASANCLFFRNCVHCTNPPNCVSYLCVLFVCRYAFAIIKQWYGIWCCTVWAMFNLTKSCDALIDIMRKRSIWPLGLTHKHTHTQHATHKSTVHSIHYTSSHNKWQITTRQTTAAETDKCIKFAPSIWLALTECLKSWFRSKAWEFVFGLYAYVFSRSHKHIVVHRES